MTKCILVVVAHPDDEVLGCGGCIARHAAAGDRVHVIFVADGVTARPGTGRDELARRQQAIGLTSEMLGIASVSHLGLPDNRLDSLPLLDIVQLLEAQIAELAPEIVYTHHYGDLNVDHRLTHQAVMTACRPQPSSTVREILTFEVMSSTEWSSVGLAPFLPNLFVDISEQLDVKMRALEAYGLEMRFSPHSRSLEHLRCLARHRGNGVGVDVAEAFMVMRIIR